MPRTPRAGGLLGLLAAAAAGLAVAPAAAQADAYTDAMSDSAPAPQFYWRLGGGAGGSDAVGAASGRGTPGTRTRTWIGS